MHLILIYFINSELLKLSFEYLMPFAMQIPVDFLIIQPLRLHGCYKKGKLGVVIQFIYLSFDPYGLHDYRIIKENVM